MRLPEHRGMLLIRSVSARCGGPALLSPCVLLLRVIERRRAEMQKATEIAQGGSRDSYKACL